MITPKVFTFVSALWLALAPGLFARTLHVSTSGRDGNDGSLERPLRTIQQGAELAQPGDTVLVGEGTYRERVAPPRGGVAGAPIRFVAEPGKNVIIKGSDPWAPKWEKEGSLFHALPDEAMFGDDSYVDDKNPFKVEMSTTPYGREGRREVERKKPGNPDLVYVLGMVFVGGLAYQQMPFKEEAATNKRSWWAEPQTGRLYINFGSEGSGKPVEISTRRRVFAPHQRGLGYIEVIGFVMEHGATQYPCNFWEKATPQWQQAGQVGTRSGHHWRFEGNTIRHSLLGIDFGYESLAIQDRGDLERGDWGKAKEPAGNHLILSNRITDCGGPGTAGFSPRNLVIDGNIFERNNAWGFTGYKRYETAALKIHSPAGSRITHNLIRNNPLMAGIWLDQGAGSNTVVAANILVGNDIGFDLEIGSATWPDNLLIAYNLFLGNHKESISSRESGGLWALGNLMEGSEYGYRQQASLDRPGNWAAVNHRLSGNVISPEKYAVSCYPPDFKNRPDKFAGRRFEANAYGFAAEAQAFRMPVSGGQTFTFDGWKDLIKDWNGGPGAENESALFPGLKIEFNPDTLMLTVTLAQNLPVVITRDPRFAADFFEKPWPREGAPAGPFADLKAGTSSYQIWTGIKSLGPYDLPFGGSELK